MPVMPRRVLLILPGLSVRMAIVQSIAASAGTSLLQEFLLVDTCRPVTNAVGTIGRVKDIRAD